MQQTLKFSLTAFFAVSALTACTIHDDFLVDTSLNVKRTRNRQQLLSLAVDLLDPDGRRNAGNQLPRGRMMAISPAIWNSGANVYVLFSECRFKIEDGASSTNVPEQGILIVELSKPVPLETLKFADGIDIVESSQADEILSMVQSLPLKVVCIHDSKLGDQGINALNRMNTVTDFVAYGVSCQNFANLRMPSVKFLDAKAVKPASSISVLLKSFRNVPKLTLRHCALDDKIIDEICNMPQLKKLCLNHSDLNDRWLSNITRHLQLSSLEAHNTSITDDGVVFLQNQRDLESLNLSGCAIEDDSIQRLAKLPKLSALDLGRTIITDRGLPYLGPTDRLSNLSISNTQVTDAGLPAFKRLKALKSLTLMGCNLTIQGLRELQKQMPSLKIH